MIYCLSKNYIRASTFVLSFVMPMLVRIALAEDVAGTIALKELQKPATDLQYLGQPITYLDAEGLRQKGIDISELEPTPSDLYDPHRVGWEHGPSPLTITNGSKVAFETMVPSRSGIFRFTGYLETAEGLKPLGFVIGKRSHNIVLRAGLLAKLGYRVAPVRRLSQIQVIFTDRFELENFIQDMRLQTMGSPEERWIQSVSENGLEITLQDVIVTPTEHHFYNLSMGFVPRAIIAERRILNSLLVPFSLVHIPESINLYSWIAGNIFNEKLKLVFDEADQFTTPIEDAKWIARKIARLTRQDFRQIVQEVGYPFEVEILIVEKIIARRNSLLKLLGLNEAELAFESDISFGENLQKGKILLEKWGGYGSRFSFGDPESPFSSSEMPAYFKSKFFSIFLDVAVGQFNSRFLYSTDIGKEIYDRQIDRVTKNFEHFAKTGQVRSTSFGVDIIPYGQVKLFFSRDVVSGNYMGTDNPVALADVIGMSLDTGVQLNAYGIPTPWSADLRVGAHFNRIYAHMKPIQSIRAAMKSPFKNMIVPLVSKDISEKLDGLIFQGEDQESVLKRYLTPDGKKELAEILRKFKEILSIGESFIVTDSLGAGLEASAIYQFSEVLQAQASFYAHQIVLSRLHIHRSSEDTIQVYKDRGAMGTYGLSFELDAAKVPVLVLTTSRSKGQAQIKFFEVGIRENGEDPRELIRNLQSLRYLFLQNSSELLEGFQKPYLIDQKFNYKNLDFSLLLWKWHFEKTQSFMTVTHPKGQDRQFIRAIQGKRSGLYPQDFAFDVVSGLMRHYLDQDISAIQLGGGGDDSFSVGGKSKTKLIEFQGEVVDPQHLSDNYVRMLYRWRGWSIPKKKLTELLDQINGQVGKEIFPPILQQNVKNVRLYGIHLALSLYEAAIERLAGLKDWEVGFMLYERGEFEVQESKSDNTYEDSKLRAIQNLVGDFLAIQKKLKKAIANGNVGDIAKFVVELVAFFEPILPLSSLIELAGGENNVYLIGSIQGFREGDENGDEPMFSNSLGKIGSKYYAGPLTEMRMKLGMTDSEFYAHWLLEPL